MSLVLLTLLLTVPGELPWVNEVILGLERKRLLSLLFCFLLQLLEDITGVPVWNFVAWETRNVWSEKLVERALPFSVIRLGWHFFLNDFVPHLKYIKSRVWSGKHCKLWCKVLLPSELSSNAQRLITGRTSLKFWPCFIEPQLLSRNVCFFEVSRWLQINLNSRWLYNWFFMFLNFWVQDCCVRNWVSWLGKFTLVNQQRHTFTWLVWLRPFVAAYASAYNLWVRFVVENTSFGNNRAGRW